MQQQIQFYHPPQPHTGTESQGELPAFATQVNETVVLDSSAKINLADYDRFAVMFSAGKDSIACVLHLLEMGVEAERIELHHHLVDGREGSELMDWPVTEDYCRKFAEAFGMKIYFSWKVGGFEREMNRNGDKTAPIAFENSEGSITYTGGEKGSEGTRRKFPQVAASLSVRWCSAYLKVDVGSRILTTEPRFLEGKTLVVTGERAEESAARAKYCSYEPHRSDNRDGARVKRHIDHLRPVHAWKEEEVWAIMRRWKINPHPAYHLGWGRTSCRNCIFGSKDQWATIRFYMPKSFNKVADYEIDFGTTIHRTKNVNEQADLGTPYECDAKWLEVAESVEFNEPILVDNWELPKGAFGESAGPI